MIYLDTASFRETLTYLTELGACRIGVAIIPQGVCKTRKCVRDQQHNNPTRLRRMSRIRIVEYVQSTIGRWYLDSLIAAAIRQTHTLHTNNAKTLRFTARLYHIRSHQNLHNAVLKLCWNSLIHTY